MQWHSSGATAQESLGENAQIPTRSTECQAGMQWIPVFGMNCQCFKLLLHHSKSVNGNNFPENTSKMSEALFCQVDTQELITIEKNLPPDLTYHLAAALQTARSQLTVIFTADPVTRAERHTPAVNPTHPVHSSRAVLTTAAHLSLLSVGRQPGSHQPPCQPAAFRPQ